MITIRNQQRTITVNVARMRFQIQKMLTLLGYVHFDLGIWLTTNATIRRYNKDYRGKDKPTDILSFPYHPKLKPGEQIIVTCPEDKNLGDLIISLEYVKKQAPKWNQTFDEHLTMLLAHGIAHLLGHDHQTDEEYKTMNKLEKKLLAAVRK